MREGGEGATEDEMVGWHHQFNGLESEKIPGDPEGHGSLACCMQFMGLQRVGHNLVTKHTHIDKTENRLVDTVGEGEGGTN